MKKSIYNISIPINQKYSLLYNSFTNMYLVIYPYHKRMLDEGENFIRENYPEFYAQLINVGYFVENELNEVDLLSRRIAEIDNTNERYLLTINPTVNCNFRCWYCYEDHTPKSKMDARILERTKRLITNISYLDSIRNFKLGFFGGEPLLYFKDVVLPIMEHYNECCKSHDIDTFIGFTTNGYLINDSMIHQFKQNGVNFFQITLDGCKEDHDNTRFTAKGKGSYDRIVDNIKNLAANCFRVVLRINYTSKNIGRITEIGNDIKDILPEDKKYISINMQRVWQDSSNSNRENEKTVEEQIEKIIDEFYKFGFITTIVSPNFVLNSCYADKKNQIVINYNGDLYKCTARDFNKANSVGFLSETGELMLNHEKMCKRSCIRFSKAVCHQCRIAPLCGGGCSQKHIDNLEKKTCLLDYNEQKKDDIVINQFYNAFVRNHEISIATSA